MPADMRLFEAAPLKIKKQLLQGSLCQLKKKDVTGLVEADAGIGDRVNMGYQTQT